MRVLINIPTYASEKTIGFTLKSLLNQNYKDFSVVICYKPKKEDRTLEIIENFKKFLDIKVLIQKKGWFEDAVKMLLEYSRKRCDLIIYVDSDTYLSKNFLSSYINFHDQNELCGVCSGKISSGYLINNKIKLLHDSFSFKKILFLLSPEELLIGATPINKIMNQYELYVADHGLLTINPKKVYFYIKRRAKTFSWKTLDIVGANMSIKSEAVKNFNLKPITKKGFLWEIKMCVHVLLNGFEVKRFNDSEVIHFHRPSLSRPETPESLYHLGIEEGLFLSYIANLFQINFDKLKAKLLTIKKQQILSLLSGNSNIYYFSRGLEKGILASLYIIENKLNEKFIYKNLLPKLEG